MLSKKSKQLKDKLTPALFVFATVVLVFLILLVAQSLIDEYSVGCSRHDVFKELEDKVY